jgi:hypothetical protein
MKIALYIEDGLEQIVLTPESDTEKGILGKMHDGSRELDIKKGAFFECKGGWMRHGVHTVHSTYGRSEENDESTMIILREKPPEAPPSPPEYDMRMESGE